MSSSVKDFAIGAVLVTGGILLTGASSGLLSSVGGALIAQGSSHLIQGVKKLNDTQERIDGVKMTVTSTDAAIPVVYGVQRVGMKVVDARVLDEADSATTIDAADIDDIFSGAEDRDILLKVGAFALGGEGGHGVEKIDKIRMYDRDTIANAIATAATLPSGTGSPATAPVSTGVTAEYQSHLKYSLEGGDDDLATRGINTMITKGLGWAAGAKGVGVAYGAFYLKYDTEVWTQGSPKITAEITGNKVYDPRTSAWIGYAASGASSDNPALCILDYLTSKRYGCAVPYAARDGGSLDFIDEASFTAAATYCDVLVDQYDSGPQEKRFRMNAVIQTERVAGANLAEMLLTCRGSLVWQNGKYRLVIRQTVASSDMATLQLTEDNIVGEIKWSRLGTSVPNRMTATFPDPKDFGSGSGNYVANTVVWPPSSSTTYLAEDNNVENMAEIGLPYTTSYYQAQRTIMVMLKEARNDVVAEIVATQAAYQLKIGDVVKVTHEGPGWDELTMTVMGMALTPDGLVRLNLQQYTAGAYTLDALTVQPSVTTTNLPDTTRLGNIVEIVEDRYVSQGAVSTALATQSWHRRITVNTGTTCRNLRVVFSFTRPAAGTDPAATISRDYNFDVAANSPVTFSLKESAGGSTQTFLAVDDSGTTKYDPAFSVTITPSDATGGSGKVGLAQTTDSRGIEVEDDVGVRLDAEVSDAFIENADTRVAFVNFTSSADFIAQQFEVTGGDKNIRSVIVRLMGNGSPGGPMRPYIYSNTAGSPDVPNAQLKLGLSIDADTITTSGTGEDVEFLFDDHTLANGKYWFVLETSPTVSDYIKIGVDDGSPDFGYPTASSTDLGSWTAITGKSLCRFAVTKTAFQKVPARDLTTMAGLKAEWIANDGRVALSVEPGYVSGSGGDITGVTAGTGLSGGGTSGNVTLNVEASQTQITSVGALGAGSISSTFGPIDVGASNIDGGTITAETAFVPDAADGASLGTASLEFSDLYLADGAVIRFGHDQDVSLTHVPDTGLLLGGTMQLQFNDASQRIAASSATVMTIGATDEIDLQATLIDLNGNVDVSGSINSGTWNATAIGVTKGGTGLTSGIANDTFLVSTGSGYDASTGLTFDGEDLVLAVTNGDIRITGTGGKFVGDGSGLTSVVATDITVTDVAQNSPSSDMPAASYQVGLFDTLAAGSVTVFGGGNEFYYVTNTNMLNAPNLTLSGALDVDGTANLDVVDIDGAVDMASTLTLAGNADFNGNLDVDGTANLDVVDIDGAVDMASTLQVDGAITGSSTIQGTTITATTALAGTLSTAAQTNITSVGALSGGSITSSFGNIDVGGSNIDGATITADTAMVALTLTVNRSTNNSIIKLGGSPSANWTGQILFNTSNAVTNWRLASGQDVAGAFTITPSTAAGGETYTTPHFVIKDNSTSGYNVGLGTTAPGHRLVVDNGSAYCYVQISGMSRSLYLGHDSSGAVVYSTGAVPITFLTNSATRMTLDSGGNLGLGETSPDCIFHIKGATTVKARIKLEQTTAGLNGTIQQGSSGFAIAANGTQSILLETNGVTRMKVGSTGQVFVTGNQAYVQHGTNHSNSATVSIDFNTGNQQAILYSSTRSSQTINLDGMEPGGSYVVLMQHTSGTPPTSITWSPQAGTLIWVNGNDPVIAASGSGDCTVVQFLYLSSAGGMTPVVIGSWYQAI